MTDVQICVMNELLFFAICGPHTVGEPGESRLLLGRDALWSQ
jgi:hypothetical protein